MGFVTLGERGLSLRQHPHGTPRGAYGDDGVDHAEEDPLAHGLRVAPPRRGLGQRPTSGRYDNFRRLSLLVRQAKPERGGRDVIVISETFRRSPAGTQSRPAKVGHQRVPSVAWWRSDPRCEAYTGIAEAA